VSKEGREGEKLLLLLSLQSYIERLGTQIIAALIMIGIGLVGSFIVYFVLYIIPISPFVWVFNRLINNDTRFGCFQGGFPVKTPDLGGGGVPVKTVLGFFPVKTPDLGAFGGGGEGGFQ
jgi:hypothetical protein